LNVPTEFLKTAFFLHHYNKFAHTVTKALWLIGEKKKGNTKHPKQLLFKLCTYFSRKWNWGFHCLHIKMLNH